MLCKRFKTSVENGLTDELVEAGIKVSGCPIMLVIYKINNDELVEAQFNVAVCQTSRTFFCKNW